MTEIELVELDESFSCYGVATEGAVQELKAIYAEMFVDNTYLQHGIAIPENVCVVDVGANVGMFSLFVKSLRPNARVLAFEPMPHNLEALRKNLELHGANDVEVIPHGLSGSRRGRRPSRSTRTCRATPRATRRASSATGTPSPTHGATRSATRCTGANRSR